MLEGFAGLDTYIHVYIHIMYILLYMSHSFVHIRGVERWGSTLLNLRPLQPSWPMEEWSHGAIQAVAVIRPKCRSSCAMWNKFLGAEGTKGREPAGGGVKEDAFLELGQWGWLAKFLKWTLRGSDERRANRQEFCVSTSLLGSTLTLGDQDDWLSNGQLE